MAVNNLCYHRKNVDFFYEGGTFPTMYNDQCLLDGENWDDTSYSHTNMDLITKEKRLVTTETIFILKQLTVH